MKEKIIKGLASILPFVPGRIEVLEPDCLMHPGKQPRRGVWRYRCSPHLTSKQYGQSLRRDDESPEDVVNRFIQAGFDPPHSYMTKGKQKIDLDRELIQVAVFPDDDSPTSQTLRILYTRRAIERKMFSF
jgi:hypothetical protein